MDSSLEAGSVAHWQFDYAIRADRCASRRPGRDGDVAPSRDTGAKIGTNRDKAGQIGTKPGQSGPKAGRKWDSLLSTHRLDLERSSDGKPRFSSGFPHFGITFP